MGCPCVALEGRSVPRTEQCNHALSLFFKKPRSRGGIASTAGGRPAPDARFRLTDYKWQYTLPWRPQKRILAPEIPCSKTADATNASEAPTTFAKYPVLKP